MKSITLNRETNLEENDELLVMVHFGDIGSYFMIKFSSFVTAIFEASLFSTSLIFSTGNCNFSPNDNLRCNFYTEIWYADVVGTTVLLDND